MEKDLKNLLLDFRKNAKAKDICDYFTWDFADDYRRFEKEARNNSQLEVLSLLNNEFLYIDMDYYYSPDFDDRVFAVIDKAIEMLESERRDHGKR